MFFVRHAVSSIFIKQMKHIIVGITLFKHKYTKQPNEIDTQTYRYRFIDATSSPLLSPSQHLLQYMHDYIFPSIRTNCTENCETKVFLCMDKHAPRNICMHSCRFFFFSRIKTKRLKTNLNVKSNEIPKTMTELPTRCDSILLLFFLFF